MNNLKIDELFTMICEVLDTHLSHVYMDSTADSTGSEVNEA